MREFRRAVDAVRLDRWSDTVSDQRERGRWSPEPRTLDRGRTAPHRPRLVRYVLGLLDLPPKCGGANQLHASYPFRTRHHKDDGALKILPQHDIKAVEFAVSSLDGPLSHCDFPSSLLKNLEK